MNHCFFFSFIILSKIRVFGVDGGSGVGDGDGGDGFETANISTEKAINTNTPQLNNLQRTTNKCNILIETIVVV